MQNSIDTSKMFNDFQGLSALKLDAKNNSPSSNHKVAQQFEALFIQTMLKSMRDASLGDSLLDNDQSKLYQDMMDKQMSLNMSKAGGIGIADVIERQLNMGGNQETTSNPNVKDLPINFAQHLFTQPQTSNESKENKSDPNWQGQQHFIQSLQPYADKAAQKLNTSPNLIIAISALETGWGQHMAKTNNGESSLNHFGIKASNTSGNKAYSQTTEYRSGLAFQTTQSFRSYNSVKESVDDFANFILTNPRYATALEHSDNPQRFIQEIQKAGYATDPDYANKVTSVMEIINKIQPTRLDVAATY